MKLTARPQIITTPAPISYATAFGLGAAFALGSVTGLAWTYRALSKDQFMGVDMAHENTSQEREHARSSYANG